MRRRVGAWVMGAAAAGVVALFQLSSLDAGDAYLAAWERLGEALKAGLPDPEPSPTR